MKTPVWILNLPPKTLLQATVGIDRKVYTIAACDAPRLFAEYAVTRVST